MAKEKIKYQKTYKKPYPRLRENLFPELKHIHQDFEIHDIGVMSVGHMDIGGKDYEFQDIRIILREKAPA